MFDVALHFAGQVVSLINDSPRVEGNNIIVDLQTDHPVQCSIRLAAVSSPLRDCESLSLLHNYYIYSYSVLRGLWMFSCNLSFTYTLSHYILPPNHYVEL